MNNVDWVNCELLQEQQKHWLLWTHCVIMLSFTISVNLIKNKHKQEDLSGFLSFSSSLLSAFWVISTGMSPHCSIVTEVDPSSIYFSGTVQSINSRNAVSQVTGKDVKLTLTNVQRVYFCILLYKIYILVSEDAHVMCIDWLFKIWMQCLNLSFKLACYHINPKIRDISPETWSVPIRIWCKSSFDNFRRFYLFRGRPIILFKEMMKA